MEEELNTQLNELTKLREQLTKYRPLSKEETRLLDEQVRTEHVWSSNAIEGSTLTQYETASIINRGVTIHGKSIVETLDALDLNQAYDYMLTLAHKPQKLTEGIIRDLNRLVTKGFENADAGRYRAVDAWPSGFEDTSYTAPFEIGPQMSELVTWNNKSQDNLHPVLYAAELHRRFVTIHPFVDGNGRTARLLMNFVLTEKCYPVINILPDKLSRETYMEALHDAQIGGSPIPFSKIIIKYEKSTLLSRISNLKLAEKNRLVAEKDTNFSKEQLSKLYAQKMRYHGRER